MNIYIYFPTFNTAKCIDSNLEEIPRLLVIETSIEISLEDAVVAVNV